MGELTGMSRTVYREENVPEESGSLNEGQIVQSLECPNGKLDLIQGVKGMEG